MIREFGLGLAAVHVVHRLLLALSGGRARLVPYVLVAQPIGAGAYEAVRDDPGTVVTAVDPDDPSLADIPRPAAVIAARLASGSR